jgi:peptidoglycan hydrolase-like protein with peptidoglycan-binding domain
MSVAILAARIAGHDVPRAPSPRIAPLSTAEVREMQQLLTERGFYRGVLDGKLGRSSRNAIHAFQRAEGVQPADGFATRAVLARLKGR